MDHPNKEILDWIATKVVGIVYYEIKLTFLIFSSTSKL